MNKNAQVIMCKKGGTFVKEFHYYFQIEDKFMLNKQLEKKIKPRPTTIGRWCSLLCATIPLLYSGWAVAAGGTRPNIVLIVADDAGYADFPSFGGEAKMPTVDSLTSIGKTFTNFHSMPSCSPSRSTFLTGIDNHINGLGTMEPQLLNPKNIQIGVPGYKAYVNKRSIMISTLLKDSNYHTYMVGKWHLGKNTLIDEQAVFTRGTWPIDQGFERSYGVLNGGAEHYGSCERTEGFCSRFFENDKILSPTEDFAPNYFSATVNTDKAIEYIDEGKNASTERQPFFLYYADTMPHEPNQLPTKYIKQEYIDLYYQKGWDGIRAERFQKMQAAGLIPSTLDYPARRADFPEWANDNDPKWIPLMKKVTEPPYNVIWGNIQTVDDLKKVLAKKMAIYTGMLEMFDSQVGRIVNHLKEIGEYDNTVFIYFSDNGGDGVEWDWLERNLLIHKGVDNSLENLGGRGSFISNGPQWAQAVNGSLYGSKGTVAEAGIRSPLIIAYPAGNIAAGSKTNTMATVADLAATILDYAGVQHPVGVGVKPDWDNCKGTYKDKTNICPMNGKSIRTILNSSAQSVHEGEPIGYELFGTAARNKSRKIIGEAANKALFYEENGQSWKILRLGRAGWGLGANEPWRLYNLTEDVLESNDLSQQNPEKLAQLMGMYYEYEQNVGIVPQTAKKETNVTPGAEVRYQFQLKNKEDAAETYQLSCRSDWTCSLSSPTSVTLAAGETTTVDVTVRVPTTVIGQTRTTQVIMARENKPQMSTSQVLVTQVAEKAGDVTEYDRVMNWGEAKVDPALLAPEGRKIMQISGYKVRYYPKTKTYLGYKPGDNNIYIYNLERYGDKIKLVDSLPNLLTKATQVGF